MSPTIAELKTELQKAHNSWTTIDWTLGGPEGEREPTVEELSEVESDAHKANFHIGEALEMLERGTGLALIQEQIQLASNLESKYGDNPTFRNPLEMVEALIEEDKEND